ncbi:hypothetical protein RJ639_014424 [Escallonia herrerae]|uniref:Phospho-2-dehydro-3-deoxyheptonate aldolase n=1 Tax=Escallonia herrerae TaxID=1293975 RepID=A0AA88VGM3_9ASTE|nr:hypothetical protein RJ639_014424 [Escallonia herrerae]
MLDRHGPWIMAAQLVGGQWRSGVVQRDATTRESAARVGYLKKILEYPDEAELESVLWTLEEFPPLVFAGEARNLEERLAKAAVGRAFLLQGGDCAKSFKEFSANNIRNTFKVLLQMGVVLTFGGQMPEIKGYAKEVLKKFKMLDSKPVKTPMVGRIAGQFAKPRSGIYEEKGEVRLPIYKGDIIDGDAFDEKSRVADPQRMIRAYCRAAATLNLLPAFAIGGYATMQRVTKWNLNLVEHIKQGDIRRFNRYQELAQRVDEALGFMFATGLTIDHPIMATIEFWTSHECLLLTY